MADDDVNKVDKTPNDTVAPASFDVLQNELDKGTPPELVGSITLLGYTPEQLDNLVRGRIDLVGQAPFILQARDNPGSYDNLIWFSAINSGTEIEREEDALSKLTDSQKKTFDYRLLDEEGKKLILGPGVVGALTSFNKKQVSGRDGALQLLGARTGRFRRFPLYNSGFSMDLRAPTIDELGTMLRNCRLDLDQFGRQWGAPFYMYYSFILMQNFADLLMGLVTSATIANFAKPGVIINTLKLSDVNALFTYVASLMYPKGYEGFKHFCSRPRDKTYPNGCNHVESLTIDPMKLARHKFACLSEEAIDHMTKARSPDTRFTKEQIDHYQDVLGFEGKELFFDGFSFTLTVPTLSDYLICGQQFIKELTAEININDGEAVRETLSSRELRMYLPWIKRVSALNEEGEVLGFVEDPDGKSLILDQVMSNPEYTTGLRDKLIDYISGTQITHIGYPVFTCPKCGYRADIKSGFFTVDAISSFFTVLLKKSTERFTTA